MHTVRTGRDRHEIVEVHDVKNCAGCQGRLAYPHIKIGWHQCDCAGSDGHRTLYCLDCGTWNYDPPCIGSGKIVGGVGYFGS